MFEKFRFGSYRIDDSELANLKSNNNNSKLYAVAVEFLDSKTEKFNFEVSLFSIYTFHIPPCFIISCDKNINQFCNNIFLHRKKQKAVNY